MNYCLENSSMPLWFNGCHHYKDCLWWQLSTWAHQVSNCVCYRGLLIISIVQWNCWHIQAINQNFKGLITWDTGLTYLSRLKLRTCIPQYLLLLIPASPQMCIKEDNVKQNLTTRILRWFWFLFISWDSSWTIKQQTKTLSYTTVKSHVLTSQINSKLIVCWTACSCWHLWKHESSALLSLCEGNPLSPVVSFPSQRVSNEKNISMPWFHHVNNYTPFHFANHSPEKIESCHI